MITRERSPRPQTGRSSHRPQAARPDLRAGSAAGQIRPVSLRRPRSSTEALLRVPRVAAAQGGAFTRAQARAEGWSKDQVAHRVASGRWRPVTPAALVAADGPLSARTLAWAGRLTWPDAVVSHTTAAAVLRMPVPTDGRAHVTLPATRHPVTGLRLHVAPLGDDECRQVGGLVVTAPARTAVDCLASLPLEDARRLLAWVTTRQVLDRTGLAAATRARTGRHGTPQLVRLLRETSSGALSPAELRLHDVLRRAGITGWIANAPVPDVDGVVADVLFAAERVVVEVDGFAAHSGRDAFVTDRRRQNRLVNAGYAVLRFSWDDLVERPQAVAAEIRAALRRS